jgi:protoporphyrinogen oxidase
MKTGILGGGLAGLTVASFLNHDFEILEKNEECGGLCRSFRKEGFTFDYGGGHIIFSKNPQIITFVKKLMRGNLRKCRRNTKIFFRGRYVKYPFENGLSDLGIGDTIECLYSFVENWIRRERSQLRKPRNAREWMYYRFGRGIAEKYLIPYNEKIWRLPLELMDLSWVEGRVPNPSLEDVVKSALGIPTEGYTEQLYFYYPKKGGIQSLIKRLEEMAGGRITPNFKVRSIKKEDGKWVVSDGAREKTFDQIVFTGAVQDLSEVYGETPAEVKAAVQALRYNSLITVCLALDTKNLNDLSWLYFPHQEDGMFHRVSFPFNYSPNVVPPGKSSATVELTCDFGGRLWKEKDERLVEHVIEKLHQNGVIDKRKVRFSEVRRTQYAYVVHDLDYGKNTKVFRDFFKREGIELCGRFSEFMYLNMDATMERAIVTAQRLNERKPDVIF